MGWLEWPIISTTSSQERERVVATYVARGYDVDQDPHEEESVWLFNGDTCVQVAIDPNHVGDSICHCVADTSELVAHFDALQRDGTIVVPMTVEKDTQFFIGYDRNGERHRYVFDPVFAGALR